jgi:hypothetical protein
MRLHTHPAVFSGPKAISAGFGRLLAWWPARRSDGGSHHASGGGQAVRVSARRDLKQSPKTSDNSRLTRFCLALSIAVLGGVEAFALSLPLGYALGGVHAPKSEFRGLAVFGTMLITGVAAAVTVSTALLLLTVRRSPMSQFRLKRVLGTLLASVAVAVVFGALTFHSENGPLWAIGISAAVLTIGLAREFSRGEFE